MTAESPRRASSLELPTPTAERYKRASLRSKDATAAYSTHLMEAFPVIRGLGLPLSVLAAAAVLAGCGGGDDPAGGGAAKTSASASASASSSSVAEHNRADVSFAQGMIPHHQQALEMATMADDHGASGPVRALANRIKGAQQPEITLMAGWLKAWGAGVPSTSGGGHDMGSGAHDMGGMMSEPEMSQLQALQGAAWDRRFLTSMIRHHEGAVAMARTETDKGANPGAKRLAQQVIDSQTAEITEMKALLGGGSGATGSPAALAVATLPADMGHIHGMGVNPADGKLYVGTHSGTWLIDAGTVRLMGSARTDLMGFAVAGPNHFYASGHPGPGEDLPNPVGLIESRDAGLTWKQLSRAGESDFHALAAAGGAVYGFDGRLRATVDGRAWEDRDAAVRPAALAVDPTKGTTVLATTEQGVQRSEDSGRTFRRAGDGPVLLHLAWPAAATLWGVTPDGTVYRSADSGRSWQRRGSVQAQPHAFTASKDSVTVATDAGISTSRDAGSSFQLVAKPG